MVTAVGGSGSYEYSLQNGAYSSANSLSNIPKGTYTWAIKDSNGCTDSGEIVGTQPSQIILSEVPLKLTQTRTTSAFRTSAVGATDGVILVSVEAGVLPFYFNATSEERSIGFNINDRAGELTGLAAAKYNVTLQDANGCATTIQAEVHTPTVPDAPTGVNLQSLAAQNLIVVGWTAPFDGYSDLTSYTILYGEYNAFSSNITWNSPIQVGINTTYSVR